MEGHPCHLCGQPIDLSLPPRTKWSLTIDHLCPVSRWSEGGYSSPEECAHDLNNVAPAHMSCNASRGNDLQYVTSNHYHPVIPSEDWL